MSHLSKSVLAALAAWTLGAAGSAQLTLDVQPANVGPGDDVTIVLDGGTQGDYSLVLVSLDPGPITFPYIGTLEVGLDTLTIYPFGQFDSSGRGEFPCALDCYAATVAPFYMQAVSVRLSNGRPTIPEISNPFVLVVDTAYINDCDGNQIDDDCDIEEGAPDCNGNGIPDSCDIRDGRSTDRNQNGTPDECEPCVAPATAGEPGRWKLSNKVNGAVAPPLFGLRFDGLLDDDCDNHYTFDVEHPGSEVFIEFGTGYAYSLGKVGYRGTWAARIKSNDPLRMRGGIVYGAIVKNGATRYVRVNVLAPDQSEIISRNQLPARSPLLYPETWQSTFAYRPSGVYQNGGYWATPLSWFIPVLAKRDPQLAQETLRSCLRDFRERGIHEWVNGGVKILPNYFVSAASVYSLLPR